MIELERHIEILLLSNDCVIVPQLGGFMTHHIDARYDENDHMFLPPLRTLGFNPQLNINDSLLVQSYIEAYDLSYPEALQRIEDEVNELKRHLREEGSYELNDIGTLSLNEDGNYIFSPCEAGILTPTLYGLSSFEMQRKGLVEAKVAPTIKRAKPAVVVEEPQVEEPSAQIVNMNDALSEDTNNDDTFVEEEEEDVVKIKFSWIRNTVAVAAILLAVFILALPTGKTEMMTRTISNINNGLLFGMMSKDTNNSKIEVKKIDVQQAPVHKDTLLKTITQVEASADSIKPIPAAVKQGYCIVLASYVSLKNANYFVEKLQKKGLHKSEVYIHNNVTRVIYGNYDTQQDAYNALKDIHKYEELAEAWVYKFS